MQSSAKTVEEYIASLPDDRRAAIRTVRDFIVQNLPSGYEEMMLWGMIVYCVPLKTFPDTYNKQPLCYAGLASQKNYISLYLMSVYGKEEEAFRKAYAAAGKKLNMGKSCIRFKKTDDLAFEIIGKAIARYDADQFIARYKAIRSS